MGAAALESAVPQNLPVLQPGQDMFDPCPGPAVDGVLGLLLRAQKVLTWPVPW